MVQRSVKGGTVVWSAAVDLDATELLVPKGFTSRAVAIEVETLNLGFQVADGTFDVAKNSCWIFFFYNTGQTYCRNVNFLKMLGIFRNIK